jgi:tight adherence protein B
MILLAVVLALLAAGPFLFKRLQRQRRQKQFQRQLRQSIQSISHGLKVGLSFLQTLERASREEEEPLCGEWKKVVQAVSMGTPLRQALSDLSRRRPLREMEWFVTAIQVTQETGGSAAGVLDTLATTLQERETLRDKVAALTAQGRASGAVLAALPFLMLIPLYLIAPQLISPLFRTEKGQLMLTAVICLVAIGGWVIYKIVTVEAD